MTFQDKLAAKIAKAQEKRNEAYAESLDQLLDNADFVESQRQIAEKETELRRLTTLIHQLNNITPFVANDGSKYSVTVYPITFFGPGMGELLAILTSSRSAFTDDLMMQYSAITGISNIELQEAEAAIGRPAYCQKDGTFVEAVPGDLPKLKQLLQSIVIKMGLRTVNPAELTADKYSLWYTKTELAAQKKAANIAKDATLNTMKFTMEG